MATKCASPGKRSRHPHAAYARLDPVRQAHTNSAIKAVSIYENPLRLYADHFIHKSVQVKSTPRQAPCVRTKGVLPAQIKAMAHPLDVHHSQRIEL